MSHQTENIESSAPFIPAGHRSGAANAQESAAVGTDAAYGNTAQNQPPALEVSGISKTFGRGRRETRVLNDVSLTVRPQEFVSILGPSGCGKSTLFHIIGGLEAPDTGTVSMNGRTVTGKRGEISYMPQQPALFPWRSTLDNVLLAGELKGEPQAAERENARRWLGRVGLGGFEQAYPHMLSGGMQQRVGLARAFAVDPEILLLDEPFGALDALTRRQLQNLLLEVWEASRRTVVMVTHDVDEAILLSDRILVMSPGPDATIIEDLSVDIPRPRVGAAGASDPGVEKRTSELRRHLLGLLEH